MRFLPLILLFPISFRCAAQDAPQPATYKVPMRDGIHLATDVYGATGGSKPVVLMRTPYNKTGPRATAERFAAQGYVAVIQDTRGAYGSEGMYVHYNNDDQDGFDTIEWIVHQPWCNGKVGMWGSSHPGAVQWVAAAARPAGLIAIAPTAAPSSFYRTMYQGGALRLGLTAGAGVSIDPPPPGVVAPTDLTKYHFHLPLSTLDEAFGWTMPWLMGVVMHNRPDGFWRRLEATPDLPDLDIAAQNIVGYYDLFCAETVENFQKLPKNGKKQLILGPWDHSTVGKPSLAGVDFGAEAKVDIVEENLKWFDHFLKQNGDGKRIQPVRYFVMGDNTWRTAEDWPPPAVETVPVYLHSGGKAASRNGDGKLSWQVPAAAEPEDRVSSDPGKPVPSESPDAPQPSRSTPWRPVDRSKIEDRTDVLVYTAPVQSRPLTLAGRVTGDLWISVDAVDADWALKLVDVSADGTARGIAEGILRSSGRDAKVYPALLDPARLYRLTVHLGHTAATILPGHALRLEIAGSSFPMFDRNLHTGEGPTGTRTQFCMQTIYHKRAAASRLLLPVMPRSDRNPVSQIR